MADKFQYFDGKKFTRDESTGYYLCSTQSPDGKRKRMHVYVWEYYNGHVPCGMEIHHIDGDKSNNGISNLTCIRAEEHRKYHADNMSDENRNKLLEYQKKAVTKAPEWHRSEEGRAWHRKHFEKMKERLYAKEEFTCLHCGKSFLAVKQGSNKFCSNNCKSAFRKKSGVDNEVRICKHCGKEFTVNKYAKTRFCSTKCSFEAVPRGGCGNRN